MTLISIVLPVYNSESTIERCINSILFQDFADWELIIVNDGSKDSTALICSKFKLYKNIFIVSQENKGASYARNVGLSHAKGSYVVFIDSDDILLPHALSQIYKTMSDVDLCFYNFQINNGNLITSRELLSKEKELTKEEFCDLFGELFENNYINPPWGKCYKRDLINFGFDTSVTIGEDLLFNLKYISKCSKLKLVPISIYQYSCNNMNSITKNHKSYMDQLEFVYIKSEAILKKLISNRDARELLKKKYLLDQFTEIEKKIRYSHNYSYRKMVYDIKKYALVQICLNCEAKITYFKWNTFRWFLAHDKFVLAYVLLQMYKFFSWIFAPNLICS